MTYSPLGRQERLAADVGSEIKADMLRNGVGGVAPRPTWLPALSSSEGSSGLVVVRTQAFRRQKHRASTASAAAHDRL